MKWAYVNEDEPNWYLGDATVSVADITLDATAAGHYYLVCCRDLSGLWSELGRFDYLDEAKRAVEAHQVLIEESK